MSQANNLMGYPPIDSVTPVDSTRRMVTGTVLAYQDTWLGGGEAIYAKYSGAIRQFGLCALTAVFTAGLGWEVTATEVPITTNTGAPLAVCLSSGVAGNYGWFVFSGTTPVNSNAAVPAGPIGIGAAGQAGANVAGRQIIGATSLAGSATTVVKNGCSGLVGSQILNVPDTEGWFRGAFISGTGIPAGTTIIGLSLQNRQILLSAALTALPNVVTVTYNNAVIFYNVVHLCRPVAQGAIT